ncbi:MAG TPA: DinB family protein [Gemmatimonadaceae bacterium]|nr:DinB family protein [Gemmatimonadaceae bacterium]
MTTTTSTTAILRPQADEYLSYYGKYISQVPDGDLLSLLREQLIDSVAQIRAHGDRADFAYAPGKWTMKEVVGHLSDCERIFAYRTLRVARNDQTNLPGFDENAFVTNANFSRRSLDDLLEELQVVRTATIHLARQLDEDELTRRGSANGAEITPRALLYIVAGHERHHVGLLRERYWT